MTERTESLTTAQGELAGELLKSVRRYVRRQNKWFRHVAAHRADPTQPFNVRLMPGKAAKHRAYGDAAWVCRLLGRADYPHSFPDLCALVGEPCDLTKAIPSA
jgi:hypothetical protein